MNELTQKLKPLLILFAVCAALIGAVVWLMNGGLTEKAELTLSDDGTLPAPLTPEALKAYDVKITNDMNPIAVLNTNMGTIEIELFEDLMPITAGNFKKLAQERFYDGTKFHRVIDGFMIQTGDPQGTGMGGPGYVFEDELNSQTDSYKQGYKKGVVAMANAGPNTNGSQFFIMNADYPLPNKYTIFGKVISGQDVVDAIAKSKTDSNDRPIFPVTMEKVLESESF